MAAPPPSFEFEKPTEKGNENIYFTDSNIVEKNDENVILNFLIKNLKNLLKSEILK